MEACAELPLEMQCKDKSLVQRTTIIKELISHGISEDMFSSETDDKVGEVEKSQEGFSPTTPLWDSSRCTHNHQQAVKGSSKTKQPNEKTSEVS